MACLSQVNFLLATPTFGYEKFSKFYFSEMATDVLKSECVCVLKTRTLLLYTRIVCNADIAKFIPPPYPSAVRYEGIL